MKQTNFLGWIESQESRVSDSQTSAEMKDQQIHIVVIEPELIFLSQTVNLQKYIGQK